LDRDEPRFTQATKQMLESGNYVDIRYQDEHRYKKPVGIYWLQAAAATLSGVGAEAPLWVYRLPSALGAIIVVLLVYWTARAFTGPPGAFLAGLLVAMTFVLGAESKLAKTDAVLFATIVASQGALARIWLEETGRRSWPLAFVFWTALAAGILVKGPVAPMVVGLTVLALMALTRKFAWFKGTVPLIGLVWMILLVSPWFIAIWQASGGAFFQEAIGHDLLGKVASGQESHGAPPLTHLALMFAVFWPVPAFFLVSVQRLWADRRTKAVIFGIAWFVPAWIVFELVPTKLPHYTMPLVPALAIPIALALIDGAGVGARVRLRWAAAIVFAFPVVALAAAAIGAPLYLGFAPSIMGVVLTLLAAVAALVGARWLIGEAPLKAVAAAAVVSVGVAIGYWVFVMPGLTPIWISPRLVEAVEAASPCPDPAVAISGFGEPSYVFLEGTDTLLTNAEGVATFLKDGAGRCRIGVVEGRGEQSFLETAESLDLRPELAGRVEGININGGDELDLGIYLPAKDGT
jgi:4-amino-4-deoxy-L-arabinose transferase-like glycosyltransferase